MATRQSRKTSAPNTSATRAAARKPRAKRTAKPSTSHSTLYTVAGLAVAAIGGAAAWFFRRASAQAGAGHVPTDLLGDTPPAPEDRAPEAFRPDPTAAVPAAEREAFRPALVGA